MACVHFSNTDHSFWEIWLNCCLHNTKNSIENRKANNAFNKFNTLYMQKITGAYTIYTFSKHCISQHCFGMAVMQTTFDDG